MQPTRSFPNFFWPSSSEWLTVIFFLLKTERAFYKPLPLYQHNGCTIPLIVSWIICLNSWWFFSELKESSLTHIVPNYPLLSGIAMQHVLLAGPGLLIWSLPQPYPLRLTLSGVPRSLHTSLSLPNSAICRISNNKRHNLHQNFMSYLRAFYIRRYVVYT